MNWVNFLVTVCLVILIAGVARITRSVSGRTQNGRKMVCYFFGRWSWKRPGNGKFDVEDIDPHLCTHIIYSFIGLSNESTVLVFDPQNDLEENGGRGAMKRFTGLKKQNPNFKTLLAIGGGKEGSARFSLMARDPTKRHIFTKSVISFLQSQNFDGLDLDWEYPASGEGSDPNDKQNFVLLINELREEMDKQNFLLTAAVSGVARITDKGYDIPSISRKLDFISIMCYDYHGTWKNYTGHHSALGFNPSIDLGLDAQRNSNFSVIYWIDGGAPREKLILGMGTYGRGFLLEDEKNNGLYAPAFKPIPRRPYTNTLGVWGYNEICESQHQQQWTVKVDEFYQTPYAFKGRNWIGYDDSESVARKARYIREMGLGGGMIWSIGTDDFRGECEGKTFPLIKSITRNMN